MFRKHLLPNLFQTTQISSELPKSDGYIWLSERPRPFSGLQGEKGERKKITYLQKNQTKNMIHSEKRWGKKIASSLWFQVA